MVHLKKMHIVKKQTNENRVIDHTWPFGRNQIFEPDDNSQTKVEASAQDLPATGQDPPAGPTKHQHGGLGKTHPGILSNPTFITFITLPFKLGKVIKRFDSNLFLCFIPEELLPTQKREIVVGFGGCQLQTRLTLTVGIFPTTQAVVFRRRQQ